MSWYTLVIISALVLGIYSIVEKKGLKKTDSVSYLFTSWSIIFICSIPLIFFTDLSDISTKYLLLLSIKTLSAVLFFILIAKALKNMEISEFAPFLSFSPFIVLLLSFFFLGERVTLINFFGMALVVFGAYLLELKDGLLSPIKNIAKSKYIHYIFLGLFFGGICAVIDRMILKENINFLTFYFYNNMFIFTFLTLFAFLRKNGKNIIFKSYKKVFLIALLGSIFYVVGDITYFTALTIPVALVALVIPLKRLSILVSTILGGEMFHEKNLMKKTIAALIMLSGVFLIVL